MGVKSRFILSFTLIVLAFINCAEAYVGLNKVNNYKDVAEDLRRFVIPIDKGNRDEANNKKDDLINKKRDEIVNKIRLENLEQTLNEEMYRSNWIINKIVSIPKYCLRLDIGRSENGGVSENKKLEIVTKIATLEHLEEALGEKMFRANWVINKILNIAKHCFGLDERPIYMENDDALLNKIYNEIVNKTARLEILQQALDSKMYNIESLINKTVNIAKYCFELEKSRTENSRRFLIDGANDDALLNKIYGEIVNKTARLEILQEALSSNMNRIYEVLQKIVEIADYCIDLEDGNNLVRRKRDLGKVADKDSKDTKVTPADSSRRSFFQANEEKSEIQQKLLNYIHDAFGELDNKMDALNATKEKFANNDNYKAGYIMSNIDTLKVNMGNIKKEVEKNKQLWSDKQILDVYDTVIKSNKALSNLLNILDLLTGSKRV